MVSPHMLQRPCCLAGGAQQVCDSCRSRACRAGRQGPPLTVTSCPAGQVRQDARHCLAHGAPEAACIQLQRMRQPRPLPRHRLLGL